MESFDKNLTSKAISNTILVLKEYRSQGYQDFGVCAILISAGVGDVWVAHRDVIYNSWEKYSGKVNYPVPCPDGGCVMRAYQSSDNKLEGEYGELRKEFIEHSIKYYEDLLDYIKIITICEDYLKESHQEFGLCNALTNKGILGEVDKHSDEINHSWKHFSGIYQYPVPCPNNASPDLTYFGSDNKLDGRYGELRKDYVNHIIKYFTSKIVKEVSYEILS